MISNRSDYCTCWGVFNITNTYAYQIYFSSCIGGFCFIASRCNSRGDKEGILFLHESLPSRSSGSECRHNWLLHVCQWSLWGKELSCWFMHVSHHVDAFYNDAHMLQFDNFLAIGLCDYWIHLVLLWVSDDVVHVYKVVC